MIVFAKTKMRAEEHPGGMAQSNYGPFSLLGNDLSTRKNLYYELIAASMN